jgi:asparaginyl-tRNA synthetase
MGSELPVWITGFDRDTVAFYQKPNPENLEKTVNADLIFPPLSLNGFGGEIVGCGQRQDTPEEMYESLKRQGISAEPYEWYIDLRRQAGYGTSSGFGLGIERFIAWALAKENIRDVALYPRLKNIISYP